MLETARKNLTYQQRQAGPLFEDRTVLQTLGTNDYGSIEPNAGLERGSGLNLSYFIHLFKEKFFYFLVSIRLNFSSRFCLCRGPEAGIFF